MYLSPSERDYSSHFGLLFVKDLQYFNIYYVQTYLSNILIEKVVLIDENIFKNCLHQESDSSAHQLLFILFFYVPWYFLQYTLNDIWRKLQRAHKKIIREREREKASFDVWVFPDALFKKTGDILHNFCSFLWNILMKWNIDIVKNNSDEKLSFA